VLLFSATHTKNRINLYLIWKLNKISKHKFGRLTMPECTKFVVAFVFNAYQNWSYIFKWFCWSCNICLSTKYSAVYIHVLHISYFFYLFVDFAGADFKDSCKLNWHKWRILCGINFFQTTITWSGLILCWRPFSIYLICHQQLIIPLNQIARWHFLIIDIFKATLQI